MKTDVGITLRQDGRKGDVSDVEVKYFAWGDGAPVMDGTDTTLANELGRIQITSISSGAAGELDIIAYVGKTQAVGTITEVGFFAGVGATAIADSGVLTDIILYSRVKTNLEAIQFTLDDLVAEA